MSITFGEGEWLPVNSEEDDWVGHLEDRRVLPLGPCKKWGVDDTGLFFEVGGSGDPEWMRHVFDTLTGLGVAFLAGIHRFPDKADLEGPPIRQFCVAMTEEDRDEFMPRVKQAYDIAESMLQGH